MLAGLSNIAQTAEIYKWTDEQGRIHYGDRPVDDTALPVEIDKRPPNPDPELGERRQRRDRLLEQFADERRAEAEEAARLAAEKAERERRCERSRKRLWQYEHSVYLYEKTESGERRILNEDERAAEESSLRQFIDRHCR